MISTRGLGKIARKYTTRSLSANRQIVTKTECSKAVILSNVLVWVHFLHWWTPSYRRPAAPAGSRFPSPRISPRCWKHERTRGGEQEIPIGHSVVFQINHWTKI